MDAPVPPLVQPPELGPIQEVPEVGGLHHHDEQRAARLGRILTLILPALSVVGTDREAICDWLGWKRPI